MVTWQGWAPCAVRMCEANVARRELVRGQCHGCGLGGDHPWSPFARLVLGRAFGTDALVVPCSSATVTTHCTCYLPVTLAALGEMEALHAIVSHKSPNLANGKATRSHARPQPLTRCVQEVDLSAGIAMYRPRACGCPLGNYKKLWGYDNLFSRLYIPAVMRALCTHGGAPRIAQT